MRVVDPRNGSDDFLPLRVTELENLPVLVNDDNPALLLGGLEQERLEVGNEAAIEIAAGGLIKGVGPQRPYDQGVAEAMATVSWPLVGNEPPPWIALPALSVTRGNVLAAYQAGLAPARAARVAGSPRVETVGSARGPRQHRAEPDETTRLVSRVGPGCDNGGRAPIRLDPK
jgi:hypothetical protein